MKDISLIKSIRSTPFTSRLEKQGVKAYTVYNHMLSNNISTPEDEYNHLKTHVQVWDVSPKEKLKLKKDAQKLIQLMTCRNLSKSKIGRCYYAHCWTQMGVL